MPTLKLLRVLGFVLGIVIFSAFLIYSFFPELINVDKYTFYFISVLILLLVLPTISSGKLTYFFEFKRPIRSAKNWLAGKGLGKKKS